MAIWQRNIMPAGTYNYFACVAVRPPEYILAMLAGIPRSYRYLALDNTGDDWALVYPQSLWLYHRVV
jgi:hypothetical protein